MPHYGYDSFCKEPFYQPELVDELLKGFVEVFFVGEESGGRGVDEPSSFVIRFEKVRN